MLILIITSCIFLCFFSILISIKAYSSLLSPISIYSVVWSAVIIIYILKIIDLGELSETTLTLIFCTWIMFICGFLGSSILFNKLKYNKYFNLPEIKYLFNTYKIITILAFILSFTVFIDMISDFGGFEMYLSNAMKVRTKVANPDYELSIYYSRLSYMHIASISLFYVVTTLSSIIFTLKKKFSSIRISRLYLLAPFALVILVSINDISRAKLVEVVVIYFLGIYFTSKLYNVAINYKFFIILGSLFFSLIIIATIWQGKFGEESEIAQKNINPVIAHFAYRLVVPLQNLDIYINESETSTADGQYLANGFLRIASFLGIHPNYQRVEHRDKNPNSGWMAILTYSYIKWVYSDMGLIITHFFPFILGFLSGFVFLIARSYKKLLSLVFLIYAADSIMYSYSTWRPGDVAFIISIFIFLFINMQIKIMGLFSKKTS